MDNLYGWYTNNYTCPAAFDVSPDEGTSRGVTPQTGLHTCRHEVEATTNRAISLRGGLMLVPLKEKKVYLYFLRPKYKIPAG